MKKFIKHILFFLILSFLFFELIVRIFDLTNDVPKRNLIQEKYQVYKKNQLGIYKDAEWKVNEFGFLGLCEIGGNTDDQILLVGDSFLENMMNDIDCHLGSYLKEKNKNFKVFEIARSGMTLIEYFEFIKYFKKKINPKKIILLVNSNDIYESISNLNRYSDRMQVDLNEKKLDSVILKSPILKNILYNIKGIYYLYSNHFLSIKWPKLNFEKKYSDNSNAKIYFVEKLFLFIRNNYETDELGFLCFNMKDSEVKYFQNLSDNTYHIRGFSKDEIREDDKHWTCKGNKKVAERIYSHLILSE